MSDVFHQVNKTRRRRLSSNSSVNAEDYEDEDLDPRIQVELEKLNKASDEINRLELELDDARASFRQVLSDSIQKLNVLAKKLGACVDKARPYYDARHRAKEVHMETHKAALRFERACSMHEAAKEMVQLAEHGYQRREQDADPAWQEMLNHATMKVNEAESERMESEAEHQATMMMFKDGEYRVQQLQKDLKRSITKSKPYFEMKARFNQIMEDKKDRVNQLEEDVTSSKMLYSQALHSLEAISDDIHKKRMEKQKKIQLGVRGAGVGAESPSPPPKGSNKMDGSATSQSNSCDNLIETCSSSSSHYSTQPTLSDISLKNFQPPSVIYMNPEDARRQSYRSAIENNQQQVTSHDNTAGWDELVRNKSDSSQQSSTSENVEEEIFPWNENVQMQSKPISIKCRKPDKSFSISPESPSYLVHRHLHSGSSTPDSPLTDTPSTLKQKSKLQGLILQVNPVMDSLTNVHPQQYSLKHSSQQCGNYPDYQQACDSNSQAIRTPVVVNDSPVTNPPSTAKEDYNQLKPKIQRKALSPSDINTQIDPLSSLKLPEAIESGDDNSDTESIASAGPMLDDDQVEFLTLDFSDQTKETPESSISGTERQKWQRMSLPPNLCYLEAYVGKKNINVLPGTSDVDE